MPVGPGKYDDLCTEVREKVMAMGVILIIINGDKGWGFSVQAPVEEALKLPSALRKIADEIEKIHKKGEL